MLKYISEVNHIETKYLLQAGSRIKLVRHTAYSSQARTKVKREV